MSEKHEPAQILREDIAEVTRKALKQMKREGEANAYKVREAQEREAAGAVDTIYFAIDRVPSKEGQPDRIRARAVSGVPKDRELVTYGATVDEALFEARHELLHIYHLARLPREDWTATRRKVTSAKFEIFSLDLSL